MNLEHSETHVAITTRSVDSSIQTSVLAHISAIAQSFLRRFSRNWDTILYGLMFAILSCLLVAPIWSLEYLPLGDLPDHAGQIRAMIDFDHYRSNHTINWFTPYILAYGITLLLAKVFPLIVAIKVVLSFCLISMPIAVAQLIKQLRGNRFWVISAFPIANGYSFYWGFYSCLLATALSLYFLAFIVAYAKRALTWKSFLQTAAFSLLIFSAHPIPWAFAAGAGVLILLGYNDFRATIRKSSAIVFTFTVALVWLAMMNPASKDGLGSQFAIDRITTKWTQAMASFGAAYAELEDKNWLSERLSELFCHAIGRFVTPTNIALSMVLLIWPAFFHGRIRFDIRRWLPMGLVLAASLLLPFYVLQTYSVYCRFAVFLLPMGLFLFAPAPRIGSVPSGRKDKIFQIVTLVGALATSTFLLVDNARIFQTFKTSEDDFRYVLQKMLPEKLVLSLNFDERSALPLGTPFAHFANWYQAEKRGTVLYNFANAEDAPNVPLRYIGPARPIPPIWKPSEFQWRKHQGYHFDYFLIHSMTSRDAIFTESRGDIVLIARSGRWFLYGKTKWKPKP